MRVGLISTCYNDIHAVGDSVRSILDDLPGDTVQVGDVSYSWRWLILDVGSTDGTWEELCAVTTGRSNVLAVQLRGSRGRLVRGAARGIAAVLEQPDIFIHAIDSDVVYNPGVIPLILSEFEKNGRRPIAGDQYFVICATDYWRVGGYDPVQVEEDFKIYGKLERAGMSVTSRVLGIVKEHRNVAQGWKQGGS